MNKISFIHLDTQAIDATQYFVSLASKISQSGHTIKSVEDLNKPPYSDKMPQEKYERLVSLPHPTLQKFSLINILFVGVSRRFLAQITRHQNEVKFMSSSFQYGDHSETWDYVTPYEITKDAVAKSHFDANIEVGFAVYHRLVSAVGRDAAAYILPEASRVTLLVSATPYQWKHMIGQRTCRRNTTETRYNILCAWNILYQLDPILFAPSITGPTCVRPCYTGCQEGKMCCKNPWGEQSKTPLDMLKEDFPDLMAESEEETYAH